MRSARAADARADIWSLGAVLYGLLTGSPPFAGETMVAVYDGILKGPPSLRAARPDVPPELEEVVLRCLRVDPAERYEDVGQLAAALAEIAPEGARLHAERAVRITQGRPIADPTAGSGLGEDSPGVATTSGGSTPAALQDTSLAGEGASTETTRDPSWVQRDGEPAAAVARPSLRPAASRRLSVALGVALAIGAAGAWLARRVAPGEAPRPSPIASSSAARREEEAHTPPPAASAGLVASVAASASAPVASSLPAPPPHPQEPMERRAAPRVPGLSETPD
jgi:serine/threonine-protein kinase